MPRPPVRYDGCMRFFQLDSSLLTAVKLARCVAEQRLGRDRPLFATFFVTRRCNVRCTGCWYYDVLDPGVGADEPDTARVVAILEALGAGGVPVVQIAGGEPFMRKDLPTVLAAGRAAGPSLAIITNAMLVNDTALSAVDRYCDWALFSPHVPEELAPQVGQRQYERAWQGFAQMRRRLSRPTLGCAITISRFTAPRMDELIRRGIEAGADVVKFQPMFLPEHFPSMSAAEDVAQVIERWKGKYPDRITITSGFLARLPGFFSDKPAVGCTVNRHFHLGVHVDGTVCACCPADIPIGNLLERPLEELLETRLEEREGCFGCQRLDVLQALKLCGERA